MGGLDLISALPATKDARRLCGVLRWHIGDVVRKVREDKHWNQTQLARRAKLNKATIVRVEEGGNSKQETLEAVARAFGVSLRALYSEVPEAPLSSAAAASLAPSDQDDDEKKMIGADVGPRRTKRRRRTG